MDLTTLEGFVEAVEPDVVSSLALLMNRMISVEPENMVQGAHFAEIVDLLCRVLMYMYEKETVENILMFMLQIIQAVPQRLSEQSKHVVLQMYSNILIALMSIVVRERSHKVLVKLSTAVVDMLNQAEQVSGLTD